MVWCDLALVDGRPQKDVLITMANGRFVSVRASVAAMPNNAIHLVGFTVPGLANAHSHAFHRALRSRTQADRGDFWTWRDLMYRAAERLNPDNYHRLARATFAEMALAGVTCVGEFHYIHHQPDGSAYDDPNAMGEALLAAADEAGVRITLLDTLYLHGGLEADGYKPTVGAQRRFSDGTAAAWSERVDWITTAETQRIGAAIHSVRAVDPDSAMYLADWAAKAGAPVHAHVSEQEAENEACVAHHGRTPVELLSEAGVLSASFSAVHATHVATGDISRLAESGCTVVMCPTTERDLGDGIGPTRSIAAAEILMALGSDSHAIIDLFEEARALELDERLRLRERGIHSAGRLLTTATSNGHRCLGWDDAGAIAVGNRADLVTISFDSVRTAGTPWDRAVEGAVFAATAADVTDVYVDGHLVVADGQHRSLNVGVELDQAIRGLMEDV